MQAEIPGAPRTRPFGATVLATALSVCRQTENGFAKTGYSHPSSAGRHRIAAFKSAAAIPVHGPEVPLVPSRPRAGTEIISSERALHLTMIS